MGILQAFRFIGDCVEDLTFSCSGVSTFRNNEENWQYTRTVLIFCPNLKKLQFLGYEFHPYQTHQLQYRIERLSNLIELIFHRSCGITKQWLAMKGVSNVVKLTVTGDGRINNLFFRYFRNLWSLTIDRCNTDTESRFGQLHKM